MSVRDFERLSISDVHGSVFTDTVIADYSRGNSLIYASLVMNDATLKDLQKAMRKSMQIYFGAERRRID